MNHEEFYRHARIYEVAFGYRDFAKELDFLVACAGGKPQSFLELAAGPGIHALLAAKRGMRSVAVDLSLSMMNLCALKARDAGVAVHTVVADMKSFALDQPVDLAFIPLTSISYLPSIDALLEHLRSVAAALSPGGVYVIENNHPKDFLKGEHFKPSVWTMSDGSITVETTWMAEVPQLDSARQLYECVNRYVVDDSARTVIEDRAWLRMTFPQEIALCGKLAGLELVAEFGELASDQPFDDTGWRAVTVLKKPG